MHALTNIIIVLLASSIAISSSEKSPTPIIKKIYGGGTHFEGPHWSVEENALYWVDISQQNVYKLDANSGNVTMRHICYGPVTLVVTVKDNPGYVLITSRTEVYLLPWDVPEDANDYMKLVSAVDIGKPNNRCNDGKVDAMGRLWFGTMGKETKGVAEKDQATLYMMDVDNQVQPVDEVRPVSISNGIAWTGDNKYMFYIDSPTKNVDVFDFDLKMGTISNRRTLFSYTANNITGVPDGMTIDTDDNLWVACYNGGKVIKIDSRAGKLLEVHNMPVTKVSSVMFGGNDLSTLFVTTSRVNLSPAQFAKQPEAGSLFAIEGTGARGRPENTFVFPEAACY